MQVKTHINICDFRAGDFELTGTEAIQMDLSFPNNVNCAKKRGGGGLQVKSNIHSVYKPTMILND